ncbi:MAG: hypothetical protein ACOC49_03390 [Candidatus Bipolaricaulota bacterium]
MQKSIQEERTATDEKATRSNLLVDNRCPQCGGKMVASVRQAAASFPSPPLKREVCEESGCNYSRLVKLDSGVTGMSRPAGRKGRK